MQKHKIGKQLISLIVATVILAAPLVAQQRNTAPKRPAPVEPAEPAPTLDTLLAADTFKVYAEVRGFGALLHSPAATDLLEPMMKLGGSSPEMKLMLNWLNAHAEVLASSRVVIAGWPATPNLPSVLLAVELSSVEEAKKFDRELRGFIPTLLPTPTPTPTPGPTSGPSPGPSPGIMPGPTSQSSPATAAVIADGPTRTGETRAVLVAVPVANPQVVQTVPETQTPTAPAAPPYYIKQVGTLLLVSEKKFAVGDLRPRGSTPLEEDQHFVLARNRFATESIFLYVDMKSIEKEEQERRQKWEEEAKKREEELAANPEPEASPEVAAAEMPSPGEESTPPLPPDPESEDPSESEPEPAVVQPEPQTGDTATLSARPVNNADGALVFNSLFSTFFRGESKWPEAIAAAAVLEGDAYVVRALLLNGSDSKANAVPFIPQFASGPALVPEASNIFPADTDLFVSASLDFPQMYDDTIKALSRAEELERKYRGNVALQDPSAESALSAYEKKLGLKIKDDLLPLLGNELAVALPKKLPAPSPAPGEPDADKTTAGDAEKMAATQAAKPADPSPVVAISIKDREAVSRLVPKIIESLGFKGANLFAQTERRDDTELVSYAGVFAYAFIGNFLVVSADAAATRRVVDSYLSRQTLSSDNHFRNFTRWQPQKVLGQVYLAPGLIEQYGPGAGARNAADEKLGELLNTVNPVIDPLTYALTNDGQGALHELHIPRNLLMVMLVGITQSSSQSTLQTNEAVARGTLQSIASAEASFLADKSKERYASVDELIEAGFFSKDMLQRYGYTVEVTASGNRFEAIAVPIVYGTSGKLSFFIDESGVLRAGDHGGGAATVADQPPE